jgi:hypothetical protein
MVNPCAGPYKGYPNSVLENNSVQDTGWWAGITFGKAAKKGTWEIAYRYEHLEGDAWWEELTDSDYGAYNYSPSGQAGYKTGTNVKGHIIKGTYALYDSLSFTIKYWMTEQIVETGGKTGANRLQVDMSWKF